MLVYRFFLSICSCALLLCSVYCKDQKGPIRFTSFGLKSITKAEKSVGGLEKTLLSKEKYIPKAVQPLLKDPQSFFKIAKLKLDKNWAEAKAEIVDSWKVLKNSKDNYERIDKGLTILARNQNNIIKAVVYPTAAYCAIYGLLLYRTDDQLFEKEHLQEVAKWGRRPPT